MVNHKNYKKKSSNQNTEGTGLKKLNFTISVSKIIEESISKNTIAIIVNHKTQKYL